MNNLPLKWSDEELSNNALISAALFRAGRLDASDPWDAHYQDARTKFEMLFEILGDLKPDQITDANLLDIYNNRLDEAFRYLGGPPISDDDLRIIADVRSLAPGALKKDAGSLRKVYSVIERLIDPHRFPWVRESRAPSQDEKKAALLASSVLLAAQRIATVRRGSEKSEQESRVKDFLRSINFNEVPPQPINTLVRGPQVSQFCGECLLGERKADIVVRLHDTRLLPIECKVSNSATNSIKRINNDAAVKAEYWLKTFGTSQVVPAAVLSGVFKVLNLEQAQKRGLYLFWAHDLTKLGEFIESTH